MKITSTITLATSLFGRYQAFISEHSSNHGTILKLKLSHNDNIKSLPVAPRNQDTHPGKASVLPIKLPTKSLPRFQSLLNEIRDEQQLPENQKLNFRVEIFNDPFQGRKFYVKKDNGEYLFQGAASHGLSLVIIAEQAGLLDKDGTIYLSILEKEVLITDITLYP